MSCLSTASQLHRYADTPDREARGWSDLARQLGRARFDLAPGASKSLRVGLTKRTERLGDRNGRLGVRALARAGASGNIAQSSRLLTLALGTARHTGNGSH